MPPIFQPVLDLSQAGLDSLNRNWQTLEARLGSGTTQFTPQSAPPTSSTPPEGYTYYDKATKKVRTWDGSAWRDHW